MKNESKTKYKYIMFAKADTNRWMLMNKIHEGLGFVDYYERWEQYVMQFNPDVVFSADCLADIQHFLGLLNKKKDGNKKEYHSQNMKLEVPND